MRDLRDRVVVITGAAGGIGRALSLAFAREGSALALVDLDDAGLEGVHQEVAAMGVPASRHIADVGDRQVLEGVRDEVVARHGRVDVLVNNAGVTIYSLFEHLEPEEFERIVAVNFWGVVYGCELFLPLLRRSGNGHIVNVASMSGFAGMPFQSPYCATKFAVRGFTEALRAELDSVGIGVTCVMPGVTSSQILASARSRDPALTGRLGQLQLRHGGSPDKLARRIIRGVRRNRAEVRGQFDSVLLDLTKRAFPWMVRWFMAQLVRTASRRGLVRARP
ncbi:MAG: SDR family NAD(P)-dependent oxidoreductase [Gemmatimonadota bacterium]|nr:SDR family NAD(P)-dependent oxidoreductase [Gemmatimonadota bacterium]